MNTSRRRLLSHRHRRPLQSTAKEPVLTDHNFERVPVEPEISQPVPFDPMGQFKLETGNLSFRRSVMTWINLVGILILYPAMSLIGDPTVMLKMLAESKVLLYSVLIGTIGIQWAIFGINYLGVFREKTGLRGIGLGRLTGLDLARGSAAALVFILIMAGVSWLMAQMGYPMPGEVANLVPPEWQGKILWVFVSFTAGFCEEVAFRSYAMTRLRLVFKTKSWTIPVIVSCLAFGLCHGYQGLAGMIGVTIYGLLFALLYLWKKNLWPCVIAHFLNNAIMGLFVPQ